MSIRSISRRRLALATLAVVIPSIALIGVGIWLIMQESQLEKARRLDAVEATFQSFSDSFERTAVNHVDTVAARISNSSWTIQPLEFDSSVVLVAQIRGENLLFPWQLGANAGLFDSRIRSGIFGRSLLRAERLEYANGSASQAVEAYRTAVTSATDTLQRAFAHISLARALDKSEFEDEADDIRQKLLNVPAEIVDDFGVPLSLYAAQQLATKELHAEAVIDLLFSYIRYPIDLSPQAAYLYRAIYDTVGVAGNAVDEPRLDSIGTYVQEVLSAIRLQEDFRSVYPRLVSQSGEPRFILSADNKWLLSISPPEDSESRILVVLNTERIVDEASESLNLEKEGYNRPVVTSESSSPNRWLGPSFQGVYAQLDLDRRDEADGGFMSRLTFIVLAMSLLIALTSLGSYLWWRDMQREVATAALRSDFVSSVSHELKTPLTSIRMFAETLRFRTPPAEVRDEYLDTIISESGRLTRLLNNVLDFSKLEKDSKEYAMRPTVLQDVIAAALEAIEYPLKAQNFQVVTELEKSDVVVDADPDALEQVLLNLLTNAMKFSGEQREIRVGLKRNGASADIWIADKGIGIDESELDRIFQSYYRADNVLKSRVPGTGLGLSLVQHAVENHAGEIKVTSKIGSGSTFTITLPLA